MYEKRSTTTWEKCHTWLPSHLCSTGQSQCLVGVNVGSSVAECYRMSRTKRPFSSRHQKGVAVSSVSRHDEYESSLAVWWDSSSVPLLVDVGTTTCSWIRPRPRRWLWTSTVLNTTSIIGEEVEILSLITVIKHVHLDVADILRVLWGRCIRPSYTNKLNKLVRKAGYELETSLELSELVVE